MGGHAANTRSGIGKDGNEGDNTKDHGQENTAEPALPFDVDSIRSYRDFYYATKMGWAPTSEAKTGAERDETLSNRRAHGRDYLLPPPLAELMIEPSSPIAEYYPREFDSDPNGKRQSWEHVVCIPFIDGDKLLDVVNSVLDDKGPDGSGVGGALTKGERMRNQAGKTLTFVPKSGIKS